jgi:excisionase family DNA binding protein
MPIVFDPSKRLWSVAEARLMLGISKSQAYRMVRNGEIKSVRLGRRILIPPTEVERLMLGDAMLVEEPS